MGSEKTYKYYLFYLKKDASLYAYTPDKKLADTFMEQRSSSKLSMKKMELTRQDVNYLAREFQNRILVEKNYLAYIRDKGRKIRFDWVVTAAEDLMVNAYISQATINIYNNAWFPLDVFNKDLQKALIRLDYDVCNNYIGANKWNDDIKNTKYVGYVEEDVVKYLNTSQSDEEEGTINIDESYILFQTIGRTMKE